MAPTLVHLISYAILTTFAASDEVGALLALKRALTVPPAAAAFFATWDAAAASPCNFAGVTCDPVARAVTAISIQSQGVAAAPFPFDAICGRGALPALAALSLPENSLAGGIAGVAACTGLQDLTLAFNGFSGAAPDLSPLTKLRTLNISSNSFAGAFPWGSLAAMADLAVLVLGDNPIILARTDSFPVEVTKLTNLPVLYVTAANIGGVIPPGIGNLVNLEISDNYLTGEIPQEITKLADLQALELYNNSLHGHLPAGFSGSARTRYPAMCLTGCGPYQTSIPLTLRKTISPATLAPASGMARRLTIFDSTATGSPAQYRRASVIWPVSQSLTLQAIG